MNYFFFGGAFFAACLASSSSNFQRSSGVKFQSRALYLKVGPSAHYWPLILAWILQTCSPIGIVSPMSGMLNPSLPSLFQIAFVETTVSPITHQSIIFPFKNSSPNKYIQVVDHFENVLTSSVSSAIFFYSSSAFFYYSSGDNYRSSTCSSCSQNCCFCSSFRPSG